MIRLLALSRAADTLPTIQATLDAGVVLLEGRGERLQALLAAPWQDEWGVVHCPCGGATRPTLPGWHGPVCRC